MSEWVKLDWTGVEAFRLEAIPAPERDTRDERQGRRAREERGEEEKEYLHIYGKRETRKENTCTLPPARCSLPPPSLLCHHDTGGNPSHSQSCFCRLTLPSLFSAEHPSIPFIASRFCTNSDDDDIISCFANPQEKEREREKGKRKEEKNKKE